VEWPRGLRPQAAPRLRLAVASYEIMLLGRFAVRVGGQPVPDGAWRHKRAAELVKILALADAHRLHSEQVIDLLWPDLTPEAAAGNLRKAVHFARAALGDADAIGRNGAMLELCPGGQVLVDALAFEAAARAGQQGALGAYQGDLLPDDRYAPWAEEPRERLRALHLKLLKTAGLWERVLDADPADEDASQVLMQRAIDAGDRRAAVRQFERLRAFLRADLGVGPDRASVALYEQAILMEGPGLPTAAERTRAVLARALVQLNSGELDQAEQTARQARTLAIDAGLGREIGEASFVLGVLANLRGKWKQQFRGEFIAATGTDPRSSAHVLDAHLCLAESCLYGPAGHEGIAEYARELQALAERAESARGRALASFLLGEAELLSGRLVAARQLLTTAVSLYEQAAARSGQVLAMHRLAEVALAGAQRKQAITLLRRSLLLADQCWLEPHITVRIHGTLVAATVDPHGAVLRVEDADRALDRRNVCPPCSMAFRMAAAVTFARTGHLDQARHRLQAAERIAGMWQGGAWHAAAWEVRGVLRQAEGDTIRATALYNEAADQFAELGRPLDSDRCRAAARFVGRGGAGRQPARRRVPPPASPAPLHCRATGVTRPGIS
jgi:DNA-binding SARP family transcriptional activator